MTGSPTASGHAVHGLASGRPAAFFDLDKTIIARSSTLAFTKPFQAGGLISRRAVLRSAYAQFVYQVGGADHDQMEKMRQFISALCAGWDVQTVRDIVAETLHNVVDPLVYDEAVSLIEEHHLAGRDVIIVSASGSEVVEPIGELLGADGVVATQMQIVDGRYTGEIDYYAYSRGEGQRDPRGWPSSGATTCSERHYATAFDHRSADARGGRTPLRSQPRPGPAQRGQRPRLAGARVHQAGHVAQPDAASAERTDPGGAGARHRCRGRRGGLRRGPPSRRAGA